MRRRLAGLFFLHVWFGFAPPLAADAPPTGALTALLDAEVAPHFPANQPGAAVLVRKGDAVLLRKGYGLADLEKRTPMKPELVFRLGSITKQFTATAVMMLVEAGKVGLADDLRQWVPGYPDKGARITIEHLLTHTSGIPSYTDQPAFRARAKDDLTHEQLLGLFKDLPLHFPPGTQWKYSNSGYYLLGLVIERASGKSYAAFLDEKIFKPLGMSRTGYGTRELVLPGGLRGYNRRAGGIEQPEPISMKPPFSAGALVSNVDDLGRWDQAIAAKKLLTPASWKRTFTAQTLSDGSPTRYGFGWNLGKHDDRPFQAHGGGIPGFNTTILRMPDDRVLVVILCNSVPSPVDLAALALRLGARAAGRPIVDPPVASVDAAILDRYAGAYLVGKRRVTIKRIGDHLILERPEAPPIEAWPASDTVFFVKGTSSRFSFVRDAKSGHVTRIDVKRADGTTDVATRAN